MAMRLIGVALYVFACLTIFAYTLSNLEASIGEDVVVTLSFPLSVIACFVAFLLVWSVFQQPSFLVVLSTVYVLILLLDTQIGFTPLSVILSAEVHGYKAVQGEASGRFFAVDDLPLFSLLFSIVGLLFIKKSKEYQR
tara:strand:+ start:97 stop:510 length:414 start_codon:yes stop_codon:yes gene_type:complete